MKYILLVISWLVVVGRIQCQSLVSINITKVAKNVQNVTNGVVLVDVLNVAGGVINGVPKSGNESNLPSVLGNLLGGNDTVYDNLVVLLKDISDLTPILGIPCNNATINICVTDTGYLTCAVTITSNGIVVLTIIQCPDGVSCTTNGCVQPQNTTSSSMTTTTNPTTNSTTVATQTTKRDLLSVLGNLLGGNNTVYQNLEMLFGLLSDITPLLGLPCNNATVNLCLTATNYLTCAITITSNSIAVLTLIKCPDGVNCTTNGCVPPETTTSTTVSTTTKPTTSSTTGTTTSKATISTATPATTTTAETTRTTETTTKTTGSTTVSTTTKPTTSSTTGTTTSKATISTATPATTTTAETTRTTETTTKTTGSTTTLVTTTAIPNDVCTKPGDTFPDSEFCYLYYVCVNTSCGYVLEPYSCIGKLKYNPITKQCDPNYQCPNKQPPAIDECSCSNKIYANPYNNTTYYVCIATGTTQVLNMKKFVCPDGTAYNACKQICSENINNVDTTGCNHPMGQTLGSTGAYCLQGGQLPNPPLYLSTPCPSQGTFPDAFSCNEFWECSNCNGTLKKQHLACPRQTAFDALSLTCVDNPRCVCSSIVNDFICTVPGLFPDPNCPSYFYNCTVFSSVTHRCETPQDDSCSDSDESEEDVKIPCLVNGDKYPDKDDCKSYYVCENGFLSEAKCDCDEMFCQKKMMCVPADSTECGEGCKSGSCESHDIHIDIKH